MTLHKRGRFHYGDAQPDIREELLRYSELNGYVAHYFADSICKCGGRQFALALDDNEGAAARTCRICETEHPIGGSDDYMADATLDECACPCGQEVFEITVGVSLYEGSEDVRWLYIGCRCPICGLTATYGDWKYEFNGYRELLARA
ncbi:MAG TPA: hypothetical protein VGM98_20860 [Schlesneria sp.]